MSLSKGLVKKAFFLALKKINFTYYLQKNPKNFPPLVQRTILNELTVFGGNGRFFDLNRVQLFLNASYCIEEENINGEIAEVGVYQGRTAALLRVIFTNRDLYLFDTFDGFPQSNIDYEQHLEAATPKNILNSLFKKTSHAYVKSRLDHATNSISQGSKSKEPNTIYMVGDFLKIDKSQVHHKNFALVHLDCDLYKPTIEACQFFFPRLMPGGFLIVHDYYNPHWSGVKRAVDTFLLNYEECLHIFPDTGGSAILRRNKKKDTHDHDTRLGTKKT